MKSNISCGVDIRNNYITSHKCFIKRKKTKVKFITKLNII